jgi:hypothetical protein
MVSIDVSIREAISPPEGPFVPRCVWYLSIIVMCMPYKIYPHNILVVVEFVHIFHEKGLVLSAQVQHP